MIKPHIIHTKGGWWVCGVPHRYGQARCHVRLLDRVFGRTPSKALDLWLRTAAPRWQGFVGDAHILVPPAPASGLERVTS